MLLAALGIVVGVPLGLVAGRRAWRLLADWLGVGPDSRVPWLPAIAGPAAALLVALAVATIAGRTARQGAVADTLRAE
jgi:predicted lysophospholipase L1 biosynthesis ABC-type transport system permease subunit